MPNPKPTLQFLGRHWYVPITFLLLQFSHASHAHRPPYLIPNKLYMAGECEVNPSYMKLQCAPSCQTCDQLSFEKRCPYDKDAPTALNPGDLNKLFERIVADDNMKEKLTILSQPPSGPWIVTLDDFLTPAECERLIFLGGQSGYERSKDVGKEKFDGTYGSVESKSRTSSNAWCVDDCYKDNTTMNVLLRIQNLIGVYVICTSTLVNSCVNGYNGNLTLTFSPRV